MAKTPFIYSEELLQYDMGPQHPMRPRRLSLTHELLDRYGAFSSALELVSPRPARRDEVLRVHSADYLDALDRLGSGEHVPAFHRYGFGGGDNPVFPGMYDAAMLYTGASLVAAEAVMEGADAAISISGGLHHAHASRASGFCILNDAAVAIHALRKKFARVAYVDIDVHHGDGVQEIFYADPTVLTLSLHETGRTLFPGTGATEEVGTGAGCGASVNIPFAPFTTDSIWLAAWREGALPRLRKFKPDAIVLQMGADAHWLDPLGHLALTAQGWLQAVKDVATLGLPQVALGGGGYNMTTVPRMWTLAAAAIAGITLPDRTPASFSEQPLIPYLTDSEGPDSDPYALSEAHKFAAQSVAAIKQVTC